MHRYIIRRLVQFVPAIFGASVFIFVLMRIIPGDPALMVLLGPGGEGTPDPQQLARVRHELGLDDNLVVQYLRWMGDVLRGDFGSSLFTGRTVSDTLSDALPVTLELTLLTGAISILIGIPLGALSAVRQNSPIDYIARVVSIAGLAMPSFWVGSLTLLTLALYFDWRPPLGYADVWADPGTNLQQMVFPALALGFAGAAIISRMTRSAFLEIAHKDFMRTARAKGLSPYVVMQRHMLRNALLPIITLVGNQFLIIFGGTVVMEQLFALPGMGRTFIAAISQRDLPIVQSFVLVYTVAVLFVNLAIDMLYGWIDPRIRFT